MGEIASFRNRLQKNFRHWSKWARRQQLQAYRVYDRDVPEFPLIVDVYGEQAHLQEYDTGWQQSDEEHEAWLQSARAVCAEVLGIALERVVLKRRERQKGTEQYEKTGQTGDDFVIEERGLKFWVNLHAYLDTGLFLDHRNTRWRVLQEAAGKRFLNLFSYTGSFSVYAAAGVPARR